jgi:hypothetical protein
MVLVDLHHRDNHALHRLVRLACGVQFDGWALFTMARGSKDLNTELTDHVETILTSSFALYSISCHVEWSSTTNPTVPVDARFRFMEPWLMLLTLLLHGLDGYL